MRAVVQRVRRAAVQFTAHDEAPPARAIGPGLLVLLGVARGDTQAQATKIVDKLIALRIFQDDAGRMNLDIREAGGAFLVVSQFTVLASTRKGRRPSFERAADPDAGRSLYLYVVEQLRAAGFIVETGEFGAHMLVTLENDGPVTIVLDTDER